MGHKQSLTDKHTVNSQIRVYSFSTLVMDTCVRGFSVLFFLCMCIMCACIGDWVMSQWGANSIVAVTIAVHCCKRKPVLSQISFKFPTMAHSITFLCSFVIVF